MRRRWMLAGSGISMCIAVVLAIALREGPPPIESELAAVDRFRELESSGVSFEDWVRERVHRECGPERRVKYDVLKVRQPGPRGVSAFRWDVYLVVEPSMGLPDACPHAHRIGGVWETGELEPLPSEGSTGDPWLDLFMAAHKETMPR